MESSSVGIITNLPREILAIILASCDNFREVTALGSTCKLLYSVWLSQSRSIIWNVGQVSIICFDEALIAVRATRIALEHLERFELPPQPFPLDSLPGAAQKPSLDELKSVFTFDHLALCIGVRGCSWSPDHEVLPRKCPLCWVEKEYLHSTLYKLFLAGAALCGVYQQPMLQANQDRPPNFLGRLKAALAGNPNNHWNGHDVVSTKEIEYLLKFPVYRFTAYDEYDPAYDQLAEFFVKAGQSAAHHDEESSTPQQQVVWDFLSWYNPRPDPHQAVTLFTQLARLLTATEWLGDGVLGQYLKGSPEQVPQACPTPKRVVIIRYGDFFPTEYFMPSCAADAAVTGLAHKAVDLTVDEAISPPPDRQGTYFGPLGGLFNVLFSNLVRPNVPPHEGAPRPRLQFVHYMLRTYFNMCFSRHAFDQNKLGWIGMNSVFFSNVSTICRDQIYRTFDRVNSPDERHPYYSQR